MRNKVQALQIKLYYAAKQSSDRKFGALYDKIYRRDVLWTAWQKVRRNGGCAGVDDHDFEYIEKEIGVVPFLLEIEKELHAQSYRPQPVLRHWIPKPDKEGEKRPLGIPIIKDRVVQAAAKLILEPIFETNFLDCSHGFRPKRSAHDAIRQIRKVITFRRQRKVIDADIRGYFNNIVQEILMKLVGKRVSDPRVLKLLRSWLRAGVMEDGVFHKSDGLGTPQGGVISPLLANIYLHSFDKMFEESGIRGTLVRYADDFVIMLWQDGEAVLHRVQQMLGRLGLTLNMDKTRIVNAEEGFDFLGVHFRLCKVRKRNSKLQETCKIWPSDRSKQRIMQRIKQVMGRYYFLSLEEMIKEVNPVIRGWNNYHTREYAEQGRFRYLNYFVRDRFRIFLRRKYGDQARGYRRIPDNLLVRLGLVQFGRSLCFYDNGN